MTNIEIDLAHIATRQDLIRFVEKLAQNVVDQPELWPNSRLEQFLEALAGWLGDFEGAYLNQGLEIPRTPTWRFFGEVLLAAGSYE